jgi:hypothetical protein
MATAGFIFKSSPAWGSSVSSCAPTKLDAFKEFCAPRFPIEYCGDWFESVNGPRFLGSYFFPPSDYSSYGSYTTCSSDDTSKQQIAVTVKVDPYKAPPEQYDAINVVFGLFLSALCVVWGFRQIIKVFSSHPEA